MQGEDVTDPDPGLRHLLPPVPLLQLLLPGGVQGLGLKRYFYSGNHGAQVCPKLLRSLPPGLLCLLAILGSLKEVQEVLQLVSLLLDAGHGSALTALHVSRVRPVQ